MNDLPNNIAMVITCGKDRLVIAYGDKHKIEKGKLIKTWMKYQKEKKLQSS